MKQVTASVRSCKPFCAERENADVFVGLRLVNHLNSHTSVPLSGAELPVAAGSTGVRLAPPDSGASEKRCNVSLNCP